MIACFAGAIIGYILRFMKKVDKVIPFVPYIALGVLITLMYGGEIWNYILYR